VTDVGIGASEVEVLVAVAENGARSTVVGAIETDDDAVGTLSKLNTLKLVDMVDVLDVDEDGVLEVLEPEALELEAAALDDDAAADHEKLLEGKADEAVLELPSVSTWAETGVEEGADSVEEVLWGADELLLAWDGPGSLDRSS